VPKSDLDVARLFSIAGPDSNFGFSMGRLLDIIGYSQGPKSREPVPRAVQPKSARDLERDRWIEWRRQLGMRKSDAQHAYEALEEKLRQPADEAPFRGLARMRELLSASKQRVRQDAQQQARELRKANSRRKYQRRHRQG